MNLGTVKRIHFPQMFVAGWGITRPDGFVTNPSARADACATDQFGPAKFAACEGAAASKNEKQKKICETEAGPPAHPDCFAFMEETKEGRNPKVDEFQVGLVHRIFHFCGLFMFQLSFYLEIQ